LPFQPRLGLCQIFHGPRQLERCAPFRPEWLSTRLAHHLDRGAAVGKGTTEKQQIAHDTTPESDAPPSWPTSPERELKAPFNQSSTKAGSANA
jgi:hypothetical protein